MYFIFVFITIVINLLLIPIRYFIELGNICSIGTITNYNNILNIIAIPLLMIVINIYYKKKWYVNVIATVFTTMINSLLQYIAWGVTTGMLFNPDAETIMVSIYVNTLFPIIIIALGITIGRMVVRRCKKRTCKT